jgi:hypothetical protein
MHAGIRAALACAYGAIGCADISTLTANGLRNLCELRSLHGANRSPATRGEHTRSIIDWAVRNPEHVSTFIAPPMQNSAR